MHTRERRDINVFCIHCRWVSIITLAGTYHAYLREYESLRDISTIKSVIKWRWSKNRVRSSIQARRVDTSDRNNHCGTWQLERLSKATRLVIESFESDILLIRIVVETRPLDTQTNLDHFGIKEGVLKQLWIRDDEPYHIDGGGLSGVHRIHRGFLRDTAMGELQNEEKRDKGELCVRHWQRIDGCDDAINRTWNSRRQVLPWLPFGAVLSR